MAKKDFKRSAAELFISTPQEAPRPKKEPAREKAGGDLPIGYKYELVREPKSERLQLLIRPTTKAAIKAAADREGVSVNELINNILEEYTQGKGV